MEVSLEEVRDLRKSLRGSVERGEVATQPRRGSWSRDNRHKKERFSDYNAIQKSRDMVEGHPKRRYANGVLGRAWEGQGHLHSKHIHIFQAAGLVTTVLTRTVYGCLS